MAQKSASKPLPDNVPGKASAEPASWIWRHRWETTLGAIAAVVTVVIAWQQLAATSDELKYQQAVFAVTEIVQQWNDSTAALKNRIEAEFPGIYNQEVLRLRPEQALALFEATPEDARLYAVRQSIVELLNYFEFIAITCELGLADESVVLAFAGGPLGTWFRALEEFIRTYNLERQRCVWRPYYQLMERQGVDVSRVVWRGNDGEPACVPRT